MMVGGVSQSVLSIYTDGGSRGNPGAAATGIVFYIDGAEVLRQGKYLGSQTNNFAEYQAFLDSLLEYLAQKETWRVAEIRWFLDSKLVVEQLNGAWRVKEFALRGLWQECHKLLARLKIPYIISYIPRENNVVADSIVNQTLDEVA